MCGKAYDPRFVFAWPSARYAVMSGAAAAGTLVEIKIKQLEHGGKKISEQDRKELFDVIRPRTTTRPTRVTGRRDSGSKNYRSHGDAPGADHGARGGELNPAVKKFKVGVLQT